MPYRKQRDFDEIPWASAGDMESSGPKLNSHKFEVKF